VPTFVVDTADEVARVADQAPGAAVLCRLATSGEGSDWPISRKYGVSPGACVEILHRAARLGLDPAGVSFHVGTQQRDPRMWTAPIDAAATIFGRLRRLGHRPWLLDLGGGFPACHANGHPPLADYASTILSALDRAFGEDRPATAIEPGRGIVGDAGVLVASVVGESWRGGRRWVYLDAGVFTGLVETLGEAIRYRIATDRSGPVGPAVLAGPTCDSVDVLYERTPVMLPIGLREGDSVRFESAGAYTSSYSTVGFNGFPPLPTRLVSGPRPPDASGVRHDGALGMTGRPA
jgi:ornithine decarboxylase